MKLNETIKLVSIALFVLITMSACESSKAGNSTDLNNSLLLAVLNQAPENSQARQYCAEAVVRMNQCIGAGSGFNPAVTCSDTNINKGITESSGAVTKTAVTVYSELITCVNAQIAATNCNFPQNKVAHPALAKSGFFSSCDAPAGLIITLF